jgi:hypothetical protein
VFLSKLSRHGKAARAAGADLFVMPPRAGVTTQRDVVVRSGNVSALAVINPLAREKTG